MLEIGPGGRHEARGRRGSAAGTVDDRAPAGGVLLEGCKSAVGAVVDGVPAGGVLLGGVSPARKPVAGLPGAGPPMLKSEGADMWREQGREYMEKTARTFG